MLENKRSKDRYAHRYEVANRIFRIGQLGDPVR